MNEKITKNLILLLSFLFFIKINAQCWQTISAGGDKTIGLTTNGKIFGWGDNGLGGLGLGSVSGPKTNPTASSDGGTFLQVSSAGELFTIALKNDGTLWSTGSNMYGFLGIGNYVDKSTFTQIGSASNWQSISAGGSHVLAIKTDGTLWAWGANNEGQLGNGTTTMSNIPIQIGLDNNWKSVSAGGYYFSVATKTDGTLWAWGNDSFGQLGNGSGIMHQLTPTQVGFSTDWQNISAGQYHVLATKTNGALWAWGNNGTGAIGNGNTTTVAAPIQVGSATNWSKISASTFASYAIKTDGTLWSWGYNDYGQLGVGDLVQKTIPVQVGAATNWQSISGSMSYYYAVAIKTDGSAWSWGINNFGVLGDGTKVNKLVPTAISCPNTLAAETFTNATISLYPNPSNGSFKIETTKNIQLIRAFDVLGNEIKLQTQPDNLYSINAKGLFLLQITFENDQIVTQKLIIQ